MTDIVERLRILLVAIYEDTSGGQESMGGDARRELYKVIDETGHPR